MNNKLKKDSKLRLFVAIELPPEAQKRLASLREEIGSGLQNIRWIKPRNLHLTLQFLGYCPEDQVKDITRQLNSAAVNCHPFEFYIAGIGGFPSLKRPRILWAGVSEGAEKILAVQREVEKSLTALGFQPENRSFHSHITVARLKKSEDLRDAAAKIDTERIYNKPIKVDSIVLFLSQLTPEGANYSALEKIYFQKH